MFLSPRMVCPSMLLHSSMMEAIAPGSFFVRSSLKMLLFCQNLRELATSKRFNKIKLHVDEG